MVRTRRTGRQKQGVPLRMYTLHFKYRRFPGGGKSKSDKKQQAWEAKMGSMRWLQSCSKTPTKILFPTISVWQSSVQDLLFGLRNATSLSSIVINFLPFNFKNMHQFTGRELGCKTEYSQVPGLKSQRRNNSIGLSLLLVVSPPMPWRGPRFLLFALTVVCIMVP